MIILVLFILLYLVVISDIITEVHFKMYFTPFYLGDNIAIVLMTIVYIVEILKKGNGNFLFASQFVCGAGFIVKGIGIFFINYHVQILWFRLPMIFLFVGKIFNFFGLAGAMCNSD